MNGIEQCLLITVVGCLAFLIFSIKKLVDDLKRSERTIWEQREEVRLLSLVIYDYEKDEREQWGPDDNDSDVEYAPDTIDWDDDFPF